SKNNVGWSLGLTLDPAWDNLPERNAFRRAEIAYGAALRDHERFVDQVQLEVREALRRAINAKERYRIQKGALELANRRVRSADLSLQAGRSSTRDLLEARDSLLAANNATTSALIELTLAQLDLQLTLEVLRIDETGIHTDPELFEALKPLTPEDHGNAQQ
ncbi:MAG TPA: TolC family protein, partial [Planctomycetota bacterium]|nr:TolC family protein [Planctomycetota bacterium]